MGISCANHGILKLSYPNGQQPLAGRDLSVSLTVLFSEGSYFIGSFFYLQVIIQFLDGYSRMMTAVSRTRMHQRFHLLSSTAWFVLPASISVCLLQLISIAYPLHSKELGITHLCGVGILSALNGLILCNGLSFLIKELRAVPTSKDLIRIIGRLNMGYYALGFACSTFGILYVIFASSDILFQLNTYFLLFTYTLVPPIMLPLVLTVTFISRNDSKQVVPTNEKCSNEMNSTSGMIAAQKSRVVSV
jgi:hypothetical protein